MPITIKFKDHLKLQDMRVNHYLSFEGEGEWQEQVMRIHQDKILKPKEARKVVKKKVFR